MIFRSFMLLVSMLFLPTLQAATDKAENEQIRQRVELIRSGGGLVIEDSRVSSELVLPALYEQRKYAPVWTRQESVKQLFEAIEKIDEDGLQPADYHLNKLLELRERMEKTKTGDAILRAEYDILLTDSLIRLGYHLLVGKVDPEKLDSNWNMDQTIGDLEMILDMAKAIDTGGVAELINNLRPKWPIYALFKADLVHYRQLEQQGGWPSVPDGPVLKPGMRDPQVISIRKRLAASGGLPTTDLDSPQYDEALETAVKRFQRQHYLAADGVIGPATLTAMNVPVEYRVDQIRANLERARWVMHNLPDEFVLVDIAGFEVRYIRNNEEIWRTRAQVGKTYRETPVFRSKISYLDINPTWTVPPTILKKDILPKLKRDPGYLQKKDMQVLSHSGVPVDQNTIDWSQYPARNFPYMIRQKPGPKNALGRIKFMFPNKHLVYLHDTPSKSLFDRNERTFSSGCIRIENPYELAVILLNSGEWNRESILKVVDSKKTTSVSLTNPVTVILLYWTINRDEDGNIVFKNDIYKRDVPIIAGLNEPFTFRKGQILKQ